MTFQPLKNKKQEGVDFVIPLCCWILKSEGFYNCIIILITGILECPSSNITFFVIGETDDTTDDNVVTSWNYKQFEVSSFEHFH